MDPDQKLNKNFSENTDREKVKLKKQLFIYLFFLLISVLFWYLNALSKNYTTQLTYTINYQNFPKGKVLISNNIEKVYIQVRGNGFHLLRFKIISFFQSVDIDLNEYSAQIRETNLPYKYVLATDELKNTFTYLFKNIQVSKIKPDSLYFIFTPTVEKKIGINPNLKLDFEKTYMQKGAIKVVPDSILVSGPKAIIDTLHFIPTQTLEIKGIKEKIVTEAELTAMKYLIYPVQKVKLTIPAEKYTEVSYTIPVEPVNLPAGKEIRTFPATVNLSFNVAISDFDKMNMNLFRASVDYNQIPGSHPNKLKIILIKSPVEARNIKFNPKNVDYLVE